MLIGWMDYPASVETRDAAVIAVFSALIVGSNFALANVPNVKLLDTLVFVSAYVFGFEVGASVAVLSEFTWSLVSPWGMAGYITPLLIVGELLFAFAGSIVSKLWRVDSKAFSRNNLFFGGILATCAFLWDFETNLGTALISFWPNLTLSGIVVTELLGTPFMLFHEVSDFLLGTFFAPVIILILPRIVARRRGGPLTVLRTEGKN
ncbi:MAG: hypothetical protein OK422_02905 [Thaumarchaeota archaeon]|nr:hypothetical protein [Nitrososphaerota archaeon]